MGCDDLVLLSKEVWGDPGSDGCSFVKERGTFYPLKAFPEGLCPALSHTIIPYLITLSNCGWMRWVKKDIDMGKRLAVPKAVSKIRNVNRLFYNEVIVRCPDAENGVVVGIGPKDNRQERWLIRVLEVKKRCPLKITAGDSFEFELDKQGFCPEAFYRLYPYLLLKENPENTALCDTKRNLRIQCSCNKGKINFIIPHPVQESTSKLNGPEDSPCGNYKNLLVSVKRIETKCRYHHSLITYPADYLAAPGLCLDAFHAAYPFALALLYDADFSRREEKGAVTVTCPKDNGIKLLIKREEKHSLFYLRSIKFLERIFELFFYPVDKIYNEISLTVVSNAAGCPRGYLGKEKYLLNIRNQKIICPASFNSIFPSLVKMSCGRKGANEIVRLLCCPDCQGAEYALRRI